MTPLEFSILVPVPQQMRNRQRLAGWRRTVAAAADMAAGGRQPVDIEVDVQVTYLDLDAAPDVGIVVKPILDGIAA